MGIFSRSRHHPTTSSMFEGRNNSIMIPRWSNPPDRNASDWFKAFGQNPRLAVVDRIASDLSRVPGKLYRIMENGDEQEISKHPFLDFWNNPNPLPEFSCAAIWRLQEIYLKIKGEGYFIIERDTLGRPKELWPVPTNWVQMTPYAGYPFYSVRLTNGTLIEVPVDDVFVMKDLDPFDPYKRGLGQAESVADEIEIDEYAAKFQKKFFFNDATPSLVVAMPNSTSEQRARFRNQWFEKFKGALKSHGLATVNGDAVINKISENMKDMDMIQGRTFLRDAVLEHFGVPREIMGITENSNRATADAAQFIYAQNVLMPNLRNIEDAVNQQLIPYFGDNLIWHFDDIVPHNQEFDKAKALDGWNAGLLTKDEARELLDIPPSKTGGNVYKVQFSDVYMSDEENPVEMTTSLVNTQYSEGYVMEDGSDIDIIEQPDAKLTGYKAAQHKAQLITVAKTLDKARREEERIFQSAIEKYLNEQCDKVISAVMGTTKASDDEFSSLKEKLAKQGLTPEEIDKAIDDYIKGLLDWNKEADSLYTLMGPLWKNSYNKGAEAAQNIYNIGTIQRPELTQLAKLHGAERIKNITETTQDRIRVIIVNALENGEGKNEIIKKLKETTSMSTVRARTIAAQECNASLNAGNADMMEKGGAKSKTWNVRNMAVARDSHKALNGKTVPIDKPFIIGNVRIMYPCDPNCNDAGEVVNCHCYLTYEF